MANLTIGFPNRIDAATLSGGSWLTALPLTNIKDRRLSRLARSSGDAIAQATINIDLGAAKTVGAFALVTHNISAVGKVRLRGDDDAGFASPLYDSGWLNCYPSGVIPISLLEWEEDNFWLGTVSNNAIAGYQSPYVLTIPAKPVLRYWRIEIDDTSNPDTYIQIGRIFIGDAWETEFNYSFGSGLGNEDTTEIESSLGGEEYFDIRKTYRVHRLQLKYLSNDEGYARFLDMQRLAGVSGEILLVPDSSDSTNGFRRNFLCRMKSLSPLIDDNLAYKSAEIEVKEVF